MEEQHKEIAAFMTEYLHRAITQKHREAFEDAEHTLKLIVEIDGKPVIVKQWNGSVR